MLSNQEQKERKSRIAAIAGTILFHVVFLVSLLLPTLRTPLPLPAEEGVEVKFDYGDNGSGENQTEVPAEETVVALKPGQIKPVEQPIEKKQEVRVVETNKKKNEKPRQGDPAKPKQIVEIPVLPGEEKHSANSEKSNKSPQVVNQAGSAKQIIQAPPDKSQVSSTVKSGDAKGNNISFDLAGRSAQNMPYPAFNSPEQGKIVVTIKVNRKGKVIYAGAGSKGTTLSRLDLRVQAENAARNALFNPDKEAPEEQSGTITYILMKPK